MNESNINSENNAEENSTAVSKKKSFTSWLTEITSSVHKNQNGSTKHRVFCFKKEKPNFPLMPSDIPSSLADTDLKSRENMDRKQGSAKYAQRSIVTQMYFENTSRNISLTSSDYLVPKFEHIDFNELRTKDAHQLALETSWENLHRLRRKIDNL